MQCKATDAFSSKPSAPKLKLARSQPILAKHVVHNGIYRGFRLLLTPC